MLFEQPEYGHSASVEFHTRFGRRHVRAVGRGTAETFADDVTGTSAAGVVRAGEVCGAMRRRGGSWGD